MTEVETRSRKTAKHTASATGRFLQLLRHPIDDVRGDFLNLVDGDLELVLAAVPRVHQIDLIFAAGLRLGRFGSKLRYMCTSARLPAGSMRSRARMWEAVIGRNRSVRSISSREMRCAKWSRGISSP